MLPSNDTSILFDNVFLLLSFFNREEKNLDKSRYRDVIPGELTRVKLLPDDDDDDDDFINANYVTGYNNENNAYIFTQGNFSNSTKYLTTKRLFSR